MPKFIKVSGQYDPNIMLNSELIVSLTPTKHEDTTTGVTYLTDVIMSNSGSAYQSYTVRETVEEILSLIDPPVEEQSQTLEDQPTTTITYTNGSGHMHVTNNN